MQHRFDRAPRWTLALGLAAGLLLAVPASGTAASDVPDQSLPAGTIPTQINSFKVMAQTFTAGMDGQIDRVTLPLESHNNLVSGWLEIRNVDATTGQPNGGTLWPTTPSTVIQFPFGNTPNPYTISPPFQITSGNKYAIVWTTKIGTAYWWGTTYNSYGATTGAGQEWTSCQGCLWSPVATRDLGFQTWVGTAAASQPPAVAADHSAVSVYEGAAGANTGTFSNFGTNAVAISASTGSITKTGTSSGSWSWKAPDEAASRTITITADDGHGLNATTTFTATVNGANPTASASGPASGLEGTAVSLTGSATSPSAEDTTAGFSYGWTVTKNGSPYATGTGAHWHFTPNDEGTYVATVKATDDGAMSDNSAPTTTNVINVAPTAIILKAGFTTNLVVTPEESLDFTSTFTDPGTADTHTFQWAFGDGASSSLQNTTHFYAGAGLYPVTLTVKDDDGGTDTATATVRVLSPQDALSKIAGTVNGITTLTKGQKNSLIVKLQAAADSAARGNNIASHNQMSAFLSELRTYVKTGKVTADQQSTLTDAIHAVEAALGTYNRMLQWWPLEP